jgi:hypothetical protein
LKAIKVGDVPLVAFFYGIDLQVEVACQPFCDCAKCSAAVNRDQVRSPVQPEQGCQIFLGTTNQNGKKCTKIATKTPNGHKIFQKGPKYTKWP